jgi:hypothetical protein
VPGRNKDRTAVVINTEGVDVEPLPVCGTQGCRITRRPSEPLCDAHAAEQRRLAAARRLAEAAPMAADVLVDLAENSASDETRRRAAEAVLDRTGLRPGVEVSVTTTQAEPGASPAEILRARLERLRERTLEAAESPSEPETS